MGLSQKDNQNEHVILVNNQEILLAKARELARLHEKDNMAKEKGPSLSQLQWMRGRALAATNNDELKSLLEYIKKSPSRRPQGGSAWEDFPIDELVSKLECLTDLHDKRLLISHFVQWITPKLKEKAEAGK